VDRGLFLRALGVQALFVGALFAVLALALPDDFFEDWGALTGPVAWILCTLATAAVLRLPLSYALFCALAGGVAGTLVALVTSHAVGLVVALLVFAASCAGYEDADRAPQPSA
jgi:tetrahydromethanopterin S-methyltransferase subunit E